MHIMLALADTSSRQDTARDGQYSVCTLFTFFSLSFHFRFTFSFTFAFRSEHELDEWEALADGESAERDGLTLSEEGKGRFEVLTKRALGDIKQKRRQGEYSLSHINQYLYYF